MGKKIQKLADCSKKLTSQYLHKNKKILNISALSLDFKWVAQGNPFLKIKWDFFYLTF